MTTRAVSKRRWSILPAIGFMMSRIRKCFIFRETLMTQKMKVDRNGKGQFSYTYTRGKDEAPLSFCCRRTCFIFPDLLVIRLLRGARFFANGWCAAPDDRFAIQGIEGVFAQMTESSRRKSTSPMFRMPSSSYQRFPMSLRTMILGKESPVRENG